MINIQNDAGIPLSIKEEEVMRFGTFYTKTYWRKNKRFRKFVKRAFFVIMEGTERKRYECSTDLIKRLKAYFKGSLETIKTEDYEWKKYNQKQIVKNFTYIVKK